MIKLLLSNLVYGEKYTNIFLDFHLKSLVSNFQSDPPQKGSMYLIFTDGNNIADIKRNINYHRLLDYVSIKFVIINGQLNYENRYNIQTIQLRNTISIAKEQKYDYVMLAVADLYYGPDVFRRIFSKIGETNTSAFWTIAFRSAYESISQSLLNFDLSKSDLYDLCIKNIHPLWEHADWNSQRFTKIPYQIFWIKNDQMLSRSYSWGPIIFKPMDWMLQCSGCIDLSFDPSDPDFYWEENWWDLPIVELCQLSHFYPPFTLERVDIKYIADWTKKNIPQRNWDNLKRTWYFNKPNKNFPVELIEQSSRSVQSLIETLNFS